MMFRQFLARHTDDCGRGRIGFETTYATAFTLHASERLDARVTNFAGRAVKPAPEVPVKNDRPTDSGAEREANERFAVARRALPHLAQRGGVRIILK